MSATCSACGYENRAGRKFCGRCGTRLGMTCVACGSTNDPDELFCGECGASLTNTDVQAAAEGVASSAPVPPTPHEPEGERKQLTVLFADVKGSMELQEQLDVEVWADIVDRFVGILAEGVRRYGGTVDKFTGDGIMALFGAPEAQEDHGRRACNAAWHMQRAIRAYAEELRRSQGVDLRVRIGLNSGEAVVGRETGELRVDNLGHTVGLAQRMEALAVPGSTNLTEHTARLVEGWFRLRDLGPMTVKGARDKLGVFVLEGPAPPRAGRVGFTSRLVGRASELAILEDALGRADEGHAQVVGIVGEPGVGKSRLCDEFVRTLVARDIIVRRAAGVSHGRGIPLLPILAMLRDYFGISDTISASQARERISDRLIGLDRAFSADLPLVYDFLEVADPERPVGQMAAEVRMRRILEVLRRVTARRSEREVLVVVLEDLHWFDPQSEAFVARLIENFPGSRTLVVTNFRPEFSAVWMRHSYYRQIPLQPLSAEAVTEMLGELVGDDPSLAPLPAYLVERTGGNPFFVEEVVRALVEDGSLEGRAGGYRLTRPPEKAGLPASVQSVLAARIDRLAAEHKPVLQSAAVIGRTFAEAVLARVLGQAVEKLADALSALCAAELVQEAQRYPVTEYRFWHPLTQEVAYGTLLAARRVRLHAAVAEALIELDTDRLDEEAAVIAWHWERANRTLEAAEWGLRAAGYALRSDLGEALRRWRACVDLLSGVEESPQALRLGVQARIELIRWGARAGMAPAEADRIVADGRALAERLNDRGLLAMIVLASGSQKFFAVGDIRGGLDRWSEAARITEQTDDHGLQPALLGAVALSLTYLGPLAEALVWSDRCLALCAGDQEGGILGFSPLIRGLHFRAEALARLGRLAEARTDLEQSIALARPRVVESEGLSWALAFVPHLAWLRGEDHHSSEPAEEAVRIGEETGNLSALVMALDGLALAHLIEGRPAEAAAACERALTVVREKHSGLHMEGSVLVHLAQARLACCDVTAAATAAEEAVATARRQGARVPECLALLIRARVGRARSETDAAAADLDAALALSHEVGASTYEPFIREELGRLRGDESELREAHRLYEAVGATGHARRLNGELAGAERRTSVSPDERGVPR